MDSVRELFGSISGVLKIGFIFLTLYILYLTYQFLFSNTASQLDFHIYKDIKLARNQNYPRTNAPANVYDSTTTKPEIFTISDGSEFSISFWLYYKDPSWRLGQNKHILSLGDVIGESSAGDQKLVIFLGAYQNSLGVSTNAVKENSVSSSNRPLKGSDFNSFFTSQGSVPTAFANNPSMCDINQIDLQKWVLINVVSNGTTLDVYADGKLARSCILPGIIGIGQSKVNLNLLAYGGFGGFISNLTCQQYALNPEQVWRYYMTGPGPSYTPWQYIASLFDPRVVGSFQYPKYPDT